MQGMQDELSFSLVRKGNRKEVSEEYADEKLRGRSRAMVFKYSVWGNVQQCMHFLVRRVWSALGR